MKLMIIGGGAIADSTHIPAAKVLLDINDIIVAEPNPVQAAYIRQKHSILNVIPDYNEMLTKVDACIIATPPHLHNKILSDCITAGKNVLCEKPLSPSSEETQHILCTAKEGTVMGMCHSYRLFNNRKQCRSLIKKGYFGEHIYIEINEGAPSAWPTVSGYCFNKELVPGGVVYDNGIHSMDFVYWCLGTPDTIEYEDDALGGLESNALIKFHYPNADAVIKLSRTTELSNTIRIKGNAHSAILDIYEMNDWILDNKKQTADGDEMSWENIGIFQLQNFLNASNGKEDIFCPIDEGIQVIRLLKQCYSLKAEKQYHKNPIGNLKGKRVLVTGGTGFIGRHIVEQLVLHEDAIVRIPVHRWSSAAYVSRFNVELIQGDLIDSIFVDKVVQDCDYIIHCALSNGSDKETYIHNNVIATQNVLAAGKRHNVKHIVQLSSVVVHGETVPNDLTADSPLISYGDCYADAKLESEKAFWQLINEYELHGSIIRPTYVWGPYSTWYTTQICKQIQDKSFAWVNYGKGICNAVFVGNVVDLCIECCCNPNSNGQAFIATDGERITWRDFYNHYFQILDIKSHKRPSYPLSEGMFRKVRKNHIIPLLKQTMDKQWAKVKDTEHSSPFISKWLYRAPRKIIKMMWRHSTRYTPEKEATEIAIYSQLHKINIDKNEKILGLHPRYSVKEGMEITEQWLMWSDLFNQNNETVNHYSSI